MRDLGTWAILVLGGAVGATLSAVGIALVKLIEPETLVGTVTAMTIAVVLLAVGIAMALIDSRNLKKKVSSLQEEYQVLRDSQKIYSDDFVKDLQNDREKLSELVKRFDKGVDDDSS